MATEKCKVTFLFETDKKPVCSIYEEYEDGTSIKGAGLEMEDFCNSIIDELIEYPLTSKRKLTKIKIYKNE